MEQSLQLTNLIEQAIKYGWRCPDRSAQTYSRYVQEQSRINELLFGDNLSFLTSLVGRMPIDSDGRKIKSYEAERSVSWKPEYRWVAESLIGMVDTYRIPALYNHVFGDEDE